MMADPSMMKKTPVEKAVAAQVPLIETRNLVKKFGAFTALNGVSLKVYPGEVHALLGDNGAGKSTLIKLLSGVFSPTDGEILVEGKSVKFPSPRNASDAGIGTVYQDLALNPLSSVTRNFFLGRELTYFPTPFGLMRTKEMQAIAAEEMAKIGITVTDMEQAVGTMSGGQRQTLAIARAIYFGAKVLILDEPTSALGQKQQMEVLKTIRRVQQLGDIAIILITHNEIHARLIADRFTFLSLGEVIGNGTSKDLEGDDIKRLMAGGAEIGDLAKELAV
jgi:simple sugar transport system ATP-binding protein